MALLGAGSKAALAHQERILRAEALRAEAAAEQRKAFEREGEEAARLRFGLLRVRWAEARQKQVVEQLEQLGLRLFKVPGGVELHRVDIRQTPGEELLQRFTVEGVALTRQGFSMGALTDYYNHLAAHPQVKMDPVKDVEVVDRTAKGPRERALTQFSFSGETP